MKKGVEAPPRKGLSGFQVGALVLLVLVLLASVGMRAFVHKKSSSSGAPAGAQGFVQGGATAQSQEPPTPLERSLPYVTEGSLFGLIGFALGYATRKFVKVGLILLALFFIGLQALVWTETVTIDWSGLVGKLNTLIFNLKQDETATQFLTRHVPSGGGMLAGYLLGFKRG